MTFSRATLDLFADLLSRVSVSAQDPNIVETAQQIAVARDELEEARKDLPVALPLAEPPTAT